MPALRAFVTVARLGSVGAAAEELHVTHSAISHQIHALETFIGVSLIERKGRRTQVTEAGRIYAYRLRQSLESVEFATKRVREVSNDHEIRISVLPSFVMGWLMPRLSSWIDGHPEIRMHLQASMNFVDLQDGGFDCAIRFGAGEWPDVSAARFLGDALIVVAAPGFYDPMPKSAREALKKPFLQSSENWAPWLAASKEVDCQAPDPIMEFTDSTHLIDGVRRGLGAALTRRVLVQDMLDLGQLVQVTDVEAVHDSGYYLVWPHKTPSSKKMEVLLSWLREHSNRFTREISRV